MADAFASNLFSLPSLEDRGDLLGYYKDAVGKLRPAILVGILVLGILMMVRSDNYDLAYAGFQGLPKLMGIALALAFLPQFMGELSRITTGMTEVFFPGQGDVSAAGKELFKAAVGNLALTNFLNLILLIAAGWVGDAPRNRGTPEQDPLLRPFRRRGVRPYGLHRPKPELPGGPRGLGGLWPPRRSRRCGP